MVPIQNLFGTDPFILLKFVAPMLFGFAASGAYYFARNALHWSPQKSVFAAFLLCSQMATLAISWNFYRNMLGFGVLLFTVPLVINGLKNSRDYLLFALLSSTVVLSHELASVALFAAVFCVAISGTLKGKKKEVRKILIFSVPALTIFALGVYFSAFPISTTVSGNVVSAYQPTGHYAGIFQYFTNYLGVHDTVQFYPSYLDLSSNVFSLFLLLYLVTLPLVLIGFFRNSLLDSWAILFLVGGFGCLILPWLALDLWSRWMMLLVFPFAFYATNGVAKVLSSANSQPVSPNFRSLNLIKVSKNAVKGIVVTSLAMSMTFASCPLFLGRSGAFGLPTTVRYVPSTMQCNSLPLVDVDDTIKAMEWLNSNMNSSSALLGQDAFFWWARLYLSDNRIIVFFKDDFEGAISKALEFRCETLYFIWWNQNINWYDITVPDYFVRTKDFGRISVYSLEGVGLGGS